MKFHLLTKRNKILKNDMLKIKIKVNVNDECAHFRGEQ